MNIRFTVPDTAPQSDHANLSTFISLLHEAAADPKHDTTLKELQPLAKASGKPAQSQPSDGKAAQAAARTLSPDEAEVLAVLQESAHLPLLKKSFVLFAGKNQFKAKATAFSQDDGFDVAHLTLLDLGELLVLLKAFHIVPKLITTEAVKSLFTRVGDVAASQCSYQIE